MGRAGALIAVVAVIAILLVIIANGWHLPKLQTSPVPKPSKPHYIDLKYYLSHGYRIVKKLNNDTYVLERVNKGSITTLKPTNKTVSRIKLSDAAWAELSKPIKIYQLVKEVEVNVIYFKVVNGSKGYVRGGYLGTKDMPLNRYCLNTLPHKITVRLNLGKYLEVWKYENRELAKVANMAQVKLYRREVTLPWKDDTTWTHIILEVPIITIDYDNDTYLRHVIVPLFKKVIMRTCFVSKERAAHLLYWFVSSLPYNSTIERIVSWEYIVAYGGVCMHLSELATAIATHLGWRSASLVCTTTAGDLHEISLLCEPWFKGDSGWEGVLFKLRLSNGTTLQCHVLLDVGPGTFKEPLNALFFNPKTGLFKSVKVVDHELKS